MTMHSCQPLPLSQQKASLLKNLGYTSLLEIAQGSFDAFFNEKTRNKLSWREARHLYREAKQYVRHLQMLQRKIITHANPQLKHAAHLAVPSLSYEERDYEALFSRRADEYAARDSVASMFSPAAYLTELYREGRKLHIPSTSETINYRNLDQRRADLQLLVLSQSNMESEISLLSLQRDPEKKSGE